MKKSASPNRFQDDYVISCSGQKDAKVAISKYIYLLTCAAKTVYAWVAAQ